ncbi:MBL fold metallo-hydrolase [Streptomyces sp. NPDC053048]|uniref:MBL fold metallo-hydrolase n=1 Tax=Streptomyces sp. NPDC053048 TaxID=3365694 RepID=UPI0037D5D139
MDIRTTQVTPDIWMLEFAVGQAYALRLRGGSGWAMVDAGLPGHAERILDTLAGLGAAPGELREIVITHAHMDHVGSAAELAAATGARILAGAGDAAVIRGEAPEPPPVLQEWEVPIFESVGESLGDIPRTLQAPCRVDRELGEGDTLDWGEEARVIHLPGHTAGSVGVHLPSSGVLFTGDTIANAGQLTPGVFNTDRQGVLTSFRRQASLSDVDIACFGHGTPIVGGAGEALRGAAGEA